MVDNYPIKAKEFIGPRHSSDMTEYKLRSVFVLLAIVALAAGKPPPPPGAPWAKFVTKPAFARSLGPPAPISGMGTISVPYIPKASMFPKFIDPRIMIAKKTDMLANLFGGVGPMMGPPFAYYPNVYGNPTGMYGPDDIGPHGYPFAYPTSDEAGDKSTASPADYGSNKEVTPEMMKYLESIGAFSKDTSSDLRRGLFGPTGSKASFTGSNKPENGPFYANEEFSDSVKSLLDIADSPTDSSTPADFSTATEEPSPPNPTIRFTPYKGAEAVDDIGTRESELEKIFSAPGDAKSSKGLTKRMIPDGPTPVQYLPGMYGPVGPMFGPPGAAFGPGAFMSKKSMFLDTLFKNLATSTAAPTVTELPVAKSTIVPPEFWLPGTAVPEPGAYDAKVSAFLDKLFDSLKLNASKQGVEDEGEDTSSGGVARSLSPYYPGFGAVSDSEEPRTKSVRSLEDPLAVIAAKDQIVNSIIEELGVLKDNMVSTFNDLVAYQKNASTPMPGSKPFKPFAPPFWGSPSTKVELGTLPYKQKMVILDQVFDMLSQLHANVSTAVSEAVKMSYAEEAEIATTPKPEVGTLDISVLDEIQKKLTELSSIGTTKKVFTAKSYRSLPASQTSFWVAYPGVDSAKRNAFGEDEASRHYQRTDDEENTEEDIGNPFSNEKDLRAIKMQMHQGYQSLPPGAVESIQAGGGSVPGHEGGGVKLLGGQDYQDYIKLKTETDWQNNRRQHHHGRY